MKKNKIFGIQVSAPSQDALAKTRTQIFLKKTNFTNSRLR